MEAYPHLWGIETHHDEFFAEIVMQWVCEKRTLTKDFTVRNLFFKPLLERLLREPEKYFQTVRNNPRSFTEDILHEVSSGPQPPNNAIPSIKSICYITFAEDGAIVLNTFPEGALTDDALGLLRDQCLGKVALQRVGFVRLAGPAVSSVICAPVAETASWNLPFAIRETLSKNHDGYLVMGSCILANSTGLQEASQAYGLSGLQQRCVNAVIQTGSARSAADNLSLSYYTVREALSAAAKSIHAANLPSLVRRVLESFFGVLPHQYFSSGEIEGFLPLSDRQCQICELVSEGFTRDAVAKAMRLSPAVTKKEIDQIFQAMDVNSAAMLSRIWTEANVLRLLARSTDGPLGFFDPTIEPTRYLPRSDDRQVIAWSDYGPASGKPVLLIHSNWTCRAVPRMMVLRLQAAGWRPIAIDRPGFGSTHPGSLSEDDPFSQAIWDTVAILDHLKIRKIAIIARRAGQFTTLLAMELGDRAGPFVLTSPSQPTTDGGRRAGIVGVIKEAFYRSPRLIGIYFRVITAQLSLERMERLTREICKGSPPDEKLCEDPQFIRDRFRAIRPFATGNLKGATVEEAQVSRNLIDLDGLERDDLVILHGTHDNHYDIGEVRNYWGQKWPQAEIREVKDGGQFLTSSHPELIVAALDALVAKNSH